MVQLKSQPMLHNSQAVQTIPTTEILSEDWSSIQGQFGWTELGNTIIPYVTRSGQKYVALRMADSKIFLKYKQLFTDEIRNCFQIKKLNVTKAEADLLNEINFRHSDNFFGQLEFTVNDGIVTVDDIKEMYEFLDFCYVKLAQKNTSPHRRCGFIRIASQNCVPYVWYDDKQYVPLFYFEGECKYLEESSIEVRAWEQSYLKLTCKVQGIRKVLFDEESIRVVDLELLKKFFPPGTLFEEFWPTEYNIDSLIQNPVLRIVPVQKEGYGKHAALKVVNNSNQESSGKKRIMCYERQLPVLQKKPMPVNNGLAVARPPTAKNTTNYNKSLQSSSLSQNRSVIHQVYSGPNAYQDQYMSSLTTTAPIVLNNALSNTNASSSIVGNAPSITACQRPNITYTNKSTYPAPTVSSTALTYKQSPVLRPISAPNCNGSKILQIPDFLCSNNHGCPYFLVRTQIEDKQLNCINMKPYLTTNLLVPIEEISVSFFGVTMNLIVNAVNVMRLDIFMPNKLQIRSLERAKKYPTGGLIKLKDFVDNLPQIRYILTSD